MNYEEEPMATEETQGARSLRITLTPQQREALTEMGLEAYDWIEVTPHQLEDRIAPRLGVN